MLPLKPPMPRVRKSIKWGGLTLKLDEKHNCYRHVGEKFDWEVDAALDEDDQYHARIHHFGVKLAAGTGKTRNLAFESALRGLIRQKIAAEKEIMNRIKGLRGIPESKNVMVMYSKNI